MAENVTGWHSLDVISTTGHDALTGIDS